MIKCNPTAIFIICTPSRDLLEQQVALVHMIKHLQHRLCVTVFHILVLFEWIQWTTTVQLLLLLHLVYSHLLNTFHILRIVAIVRRTFLHLRWLRAQIKIHFKMDNMDLVNDNQGHFALSFVSFHCILNRLTRYIISNSPKILLFIVMMYLSYYINMPCVEMVYVWVAIIWYYSQSVKANDDWWCKILPHHAANK